jgi:hypothetical protein
MDVSGAVEARDRMLVARMQRPGRGNAIDGQTASSSLPDVRSTSSPFPKRCTRVAPSCPGEGHPSSEDPQR